jgi:phospholipase/carboxylesterase
MNIDPHLDRPVHLAGAPFKDARGAVVLLHGRGGSAEDVLGLARTMDVSWLTCLAPQAAGHSWYPNSFIAPLASNEPWLSSAIALLASIINCCAQAGIPAERVAILGFSQGACLASEYVVRHPQRYAALVAFTGGLIGPPGSDLRHAGDLSGTPVLLSSGDPDPHVPWSRVKETAEQFTAMGASVELRRYAGRPHTVLPEELDSARTLFDAVFG